MLIRSGLQLCHCHQVYIDPEVTKTGEARTGKATYTTILPHREAEHCVFVWESMDMVWRYWVLDEPPPVGPYIEEATAAKHPFFLGTRNGLHFDYPTYDEHCYLVINVNHRLGIFVPGRLTHFVRHLFPQFNQHLEEGEIKELAKWSGSNDTKPGAFEQYYNQGKEKKINWGPVIKVAKGPKVAENDTYWVQDLVPNPNPLDFFRPSDQLLPYVVGLDIGEKDADGNERYSKIWVKSFILFAQYLNRWMPLRHASLHNRYPQCAFYCSTKIPMFQGERWTTFRQLVLQEQSKSQGERMVNLERQKQRANDDYTGAIAGKITGVEMQCNTVQEGVNSVASKVEVLSEQVAWQNNEIARLRVELDSQSTLMRQIAAHLNVPNVPTPTLSPTLQVSLGSLLSSPPPQPAVTIAEPPNPAQMQPGWFRDASAWAAAELPYDRSKENVRGATPTKFPMSVLRLGIHKGAMSLYNAWNSPAQTASGGCCPPASFLEEQLGGSWRANLLPADSKNLRSFMRTYDHIRSAYAASDPSVVRSSYPFEMADRDKDFQTYKTANAYYLGKVQKKRGQPGSQGGRPQKRNNSN